MKFCFFFSSRRRHTRWPRDWSSDVCSSDLDHAGQDLERIAPAIIELRVRVGGMVEQDPCQIERLHLAAWQTRIGNIEQWLPVKRPALPRGSVRIGSKAPFDLSAVS